MIAVVVQYHLVVEFSVNKKMETINKREEKTSKDKCIELPSVLQTMRKLDGMMNSMSMR